ncbi:MAG: DNA-binding protein [Erysipelotrichaceae bacterium]|nr:DNA-binding protein [Erysipelotrichaceae bacterium]
MKELAVRLKKGEDLKWSIEALCKENKADTAVVLSGVGCLYKARIRMAKAESFFEADHDFEIVSLTGTVSKGKAHIHISLSDSKGRVVGGHLSEGCLINTTCELVLGVLEEYKSQRVFDEKTGYDEIIFEKEGR